MGHHIPDRSDAAFALVPSILTRVAFILDWVWFTFAGYCLILIWEASLLIGAGSFGPIPDGSGAVFALGPSLFTRVAAILDWVGFTFAGRGPALIRVRAL